jgi:hypothetical protein
MGTLLIIFGNVRQIALRDREITGSQTIDDPSDEKQWQ